MIVKSSINNNVLTITVHTGSRIVEMNWTPRSPGYTFYNFNKWINEILSKNKRL